MNRLIPPFAAFFMAVCALPARSQVLADAAEPMNELKRLSLEELANVEVTSVSKSAQSLSSAPASIYVITRDEIRHSGALTIPEALRLAPNMQVTQIGSQSYQIGARGFGGQLEAQNFSNKILILIDGRSVYNPLFSGVAYDAQDVVMDDIERIEVISGPGATLWGANAMNGVINIITRSSQDSQGGLLRATVGNEENAFSARYGDSVGDSGAYRVYAKAFDRGPSEFADGSSAGDRWNKTQAGFRTDFGGDENRYTVQGDFQRATENAPGSADVDFSEWNLLGRWEHSGEFANTHLQVYVDHTRRDQPPEGVGFELTTYDLELQQTMQIGARHKVVWGLGRRSNDYDITNTPGLAFEPHARNLELTNVFAQDTIELSDHWRFTAGLKLEENSYSGWSTLPDLRLAWSPNEDALVWLAAARAIRGPTPLDVDVRESVGATLFLEGNAHFKPEGVNAFEVGYRAQPNPKVSWSVSAFYDDYDDLRSIELASSTAFLPLHWGNEMEGHTYGLEAWAEWQVTPWWRLSPGFRWLEKRLAFSDAGSGLLGTDQAGNDPRTSALLKSTMSFGRASFDATLRHVGSLPAPATPAYTEASARFAWSATDALGFSVTGFNLAHPVHLEYATPAGHEIRRSIYVEARYKF